MAWSAGFDRCRRSRSGSSRFSDREIHVAVEACTGWLFVCRALERTGAVAHLAEPVETSALRGRKRRAKTDRTDAKWLRQLLCEGRLPESWCPPEHVRQWRSRTRLRNTLLAERTGWIQRIRATLYHHGIPGAPDDLRTLAGREFLTALELPSDAAERIRVALEIIDMLDIQLAGIERDLRALARHQAGCRALMTQYGMGELSALVTLVELGDVTRMHASRQAVRMAGLDIGVHRSDRHAQLGKLTRQGSAPLRWALFEAAQSACRTSEPRLRRLPRTQRPWPLAQPCVHDDRPQARSPLLPPPASARPRRAQPARQFNPKGQLRPSPTVHDASLHMRPAPGAIEAPTPSVAAHERQSGRSRSTGTTDQPSRHRPPTPAVAGPDKAGRPRSRTHPGGT